MNIFLEHCRFIVGSQYVLTESLELRSYLTDWRQRAKGKALAVIKPATTQEVAAIVKLCVQFLVPIVPQGGNTGLVLGSIPDDSGTAIVLSLTRLNKIVDIDPINHTLTAQAGCILENIQQAATASGRLFPLSLAAEGSCTIGGNLATNAGGTSVLRYGSARDLCLGLEVVTAQGEIWSGLHSLRKDNTGYDLRDLYIGSEGTLGIITAAVLKLFPKPQAQLTTLIALQTPEHAISLLSLAQKQCASVLTGFEWMSHDCLQLVTQQFPHLRCPFSQVYPHYVLLEISVHESEQHAHMLLETLICEAIDKDIVRDAVIATSLAQSQVLWQLREHIPLAQAQAGKNIKHDISIPVSDLTEFMSVTYALLQQYVAGCQIIAFGHLGDGNVHYNVAPPIGMPDFLFLAHQSEINKIVHDQTHRLKGSISAEHGIGVLKREEILRYKSPVALGLMRTIKKSLDPLNIMNPGKVFNQIEGV